MVLALLEDLLKCIGKRIAAPISIGSGIALAGATINGWTGGKGIVVKGYSKTEWLEKILINYQSVNVLVQ